jgi:hypothetical protein
MSKTEERRHAVRRRVQCRAAVASNERAERHDCTVYDMSQTGARLLVDPGVELPPEFLLVLSRNVSRRCKTIWRHERQIGVRFRRMPSE